MRRMPARASAWSSTISTVGSLGSCGSSVSGIRELDVEAPASVAATGGEVAAHVLDEGSQPGEAASGPFGITILCGIKDIQVNTVIGKRDGDIHVASGAMLHRVGKCLLQDADEECDHSRVQ